MLINWEVVYVVWEVGDSELRRLCVGCVNLILFEILYGLVVCRLESWEFGRLGGAKMESLRG